MSLFCDFQAACLPSFCFQSLWFLAAGRRATKKSHLTSIAIENNTLSVGGSIAGKSRELKHICALPDSTVDIQRGILKYLAEHPLAKDTVEGIVEWWLPDLSQSPAARDVQHALETLVLEGWVAVTKRNPASNLYGLEESRREQIQEFLND